AAGRWSKPPESSRSPPPPSPLGGSDSTTTGLPLCCGRHRYYADEPITARRSRRALSKLMASSAAFLMSASTRRPGESGAVDRSADSPMGRRALPAHREVADVQVRRDRGCAARDLGEGGHGAA